MPLTGAQGGYGDTLYKLHRASVKTDLRLRKIMDRLAVDDVTDDEIDTALDAE